MFTVAHLVDDAAIGGVNRMLTDQASGLAGVADSRRYIVNPGRPHLRRFSEDVIVTHFTPSWYKMPYMAVLRDRCGTRPLIHVEHSYTRSFEECCVPHRSRFRLMLRLAYRLVDSVIAVSEGQAAWMVDAGLVPEHKLTVIHPTSSCNALFELSLPEPFPRPIRLAAYGRYCPQKGFDILINAMQAIAPNVASLTLAGYGPDEAALKRMAAGLPHVTVGAAVTDIRSFLADCDAVIVPSRWEAFGLVALEARAAGRPVIASDVDGLPEQIHPAAGFVVADPSSNALAAAIERLQGSDLRSMGSAGRDSARTQFEKHVNNWSTLIQDTSRSTARAAPIEPVASAS